MKVLLIEDNQEAIQGICDYLEEKKWEFKVVSFEHAPNELTLFDPDLVIMDWMLDAESPDEGDPLFNAIYKRDFVPIIVFSAVAGSIPDSVTSIADDNPMIEIIPKGDESIVNRKIDLWEPYILAVKAAKEELNNSLLNSAKAMTYYFHFRGMDEHLIKYMLAKRIQISFSDDNIGAGELNPPAWIEYEYPPMNDKLMVADIIRINEGNQKQVGKPSKYYVVLTPSCDLARVKEGDDPKVLVAHCESAEALYNRTDDSRDYEELRNDVKSYITTGYNYSKVPVPELPYKIPYMTINLKELEQINYSDIALESDSAENKGYYRVASISSPFRESIVWAHMINSCRPGLPDRDFNRWVDDIVKK